MDRHPTPRHRLRRVLPRLETPGLEHVSFAHAQRSRHGGTLKFAQHRDSPDPTLVPGRGESTNRYLSHMNILADYSHASYGGGVSGNNYDIGLGGHFGLRSFPHLNILVRILYLHEEFSVSTPFGSLSASANGLGFAGGVRWQPLRRVEFDGLLEHDDYGCTGCTSYTTLGAQGQYYFTPHLTGLFGVTVGDDSYGDLFRIGIRYYF